MVKLKYAQLLISNAVATKWAPIQNCWAFTGGAGKSNNLANGKRYLIYEDC